jgi:hypothetical protein
MMPYSAKLQEFVETLLARHRTLAGELHVLLQLENLQLVVSQSADQRQVRLSRFVGMYQRPPVKELEIVFFVDDQGHWIPYQYYRPPMDRQVCGVVDQHTCRLMLNNPPYQRALANHCDLWAVRLYSQGWLEQGIKSSTASMDFEGEFLWPVPTTNEPTEAQLEAWMIDDVCEATDGCLVEPDVAP